MKSDSWGYSPCITMKKPNTVAASFNLLMTAGGCDVGNAHDELKDGIDKLKGDLSNLMDLLKALNDLVGPMAQKLMDLDDLAAQLKQCCS